MEKTETKNRKSIKCAKKREKLARQPIEGGGGAVSRYLGIKEPSATGRRGGWIVSLMRGHSGP